MSFLQKLIIQFKYNSYQNPSQILFVDIKKINIYIDRQRIRIAKTVLKKSKMGGINPPDLKIYVTTVTTGLPMWY